jgi:hypothetical protein
VTDYPTQTSFLALMADTYRALVAHPETTDLQAADGLIAVCAIVGQAARAGWTAQELQTVTGLDARLVEGAVAIWAL